MGNPTVRGFILHATAAPKPKLLIKVPRALGGDLSSLATIPQLNTS